MRGWRGTGGALAFACTAAVTDGRANEWPVCAAVACFADAQAMHRHEVEHGCRFHADSDACDLAKLFWDAIAAQESGGKVCDARNSGCRSRTGNPAYRPALAASYLGASGGPRQILHRNTLHMLADSAVFAPDDPCRFGIDHDTARAALARANAVLRWFASPRSETTPPIPAAVVDAAGIVHFDEAALAADLAVFTRETGLGADEWRRMSAWSAIAIEIRAAHGTAGKRSVFGAARTLRERTQARTRIVEALDPTGTGASNRRMRALLDHLGMTFDARAFVGMLRYAAYGASYGGTSPIWNEAREGFATSASLATAPPLRARLHAGLVAINSTRHIGCHVRIAAGLLDPLAFRRGVRWREWVQRAAAQWNAGAGAAREAGSAYGAKVVMHYERLRHARRCPPETPPIGVVSIDGLGGVR